MKNDDGADLYRVTMPYFCCGILVLDDVVVFTAPILRWSTGKSLRQLTQWVHSKGGTIQLVE